MTRHLQSVPIESDEGRHHMLPERPQMGPGATRRISVQFEPGPIAAASARNALLALHDRVDESLLSDLQLLVSELVTNSVRHSEVGPEDLIHLDVMVLGGRIRVEVADPGKGFEPRPRDPSKRDTPGGWGLYLVDHVAERWGVARDERFTRAWFEVDASRAFQHSRRLAS